MNVEQLYGVLKREFNPRHDMYRHPPMDTKDIGDLAKESKYKGKNLIMFALNLPKHFIRGAVIGGVFGAIGGGLYSLVSGDDPAECLEAGLRIGAGSLMTLDVLLYGYRYVEHFLGNDPNSLYGSLKRYIKSRN